MLMDSFKCKTARHMTDLFTVFIVLSWSDYLSEFQAEVENTDERWMGLISSTCGNCGNCFLASLCIRYSVQAKLFIIQNI